jgi:beta-N-acetylhexosaminidase
VIAVPKHFPGHGSTRIDSHGRLPIIRIDKNTMIKRDLVPFKNAIDNGLDALMIGHLSFPLIDPSGLPASKSKVFITDILRSQLGFEGIAITDEIEMIGFSSGSKNTKESIITAFNAGIDVFVIGHTKKIQDAVYIALKDGVKEGKITEKRLNESVLRIAMVKEKYHLKDAETLSLDAAQKQFGSQENKSILNKFNEEIKRLQNKPAASTEKGSSFK